MTRMMLKNRWDKYPVKFTTELKRTSRQWTWTRNLG